MCGKNETFTNKIYRNKKKSVIVSNTSLHVFLEQSFHNRRKYRKVYMKTDTNYCLLFNPLPRPPPDMKIDTNDCLLFLKKKKKKKPAPPPPCPLPPPRHENRYMKNECLLFLKKIPPPPMIPPLQTPPHRTKSH